MNSAIVAVEIVAKLIGEYRGDKTATGPISLLGVENARAHVVSRICPFSDTVL